MQADQTLNCRKFSACERCKYMSFLQPGVKNVEIPNTAHKRLAGALPSVHSALLV